MVARTRGIAMGAPYRVAEGIIWPALMTGTRRDWRGMSHLGRHGQGMVLAANHISQFDPLVIIHFVHDAGRAPRVLTKDSLWEVPVLGPLLSSMGQIPVSRNVDPTAALAAAEAAIGRGEAIIVYPEGTITRDPDLWPMSGRTGALRLALETGAPLIPIAQWGAQKVLAPYSKMVRLFPRTVIKVTAGPPLDIDDLRGRPVTRELLEDGTNRLMDRITAMLEVIRGERAPAQRLDWAAQRKRESAANEEER